MEFYEQLSNYYDIIFPLNEHSVFFLKERLKKGPILDIAAGTGNHAIALAKLGFDVTATDLDENMVLKIKEKSLKNKVTIEATSLAMEQISLLKDKQFTNIICIGNSIVHLKSIEAISAFLKEVYDLLSENGTTVFQIVNYDHIVAEKVTKLPFINRDTISFERTYEFVHNKIIFKGKLNVSGQLLENEVSLLPVTSQQLVDMMRVSGFKEVTTFGSYKGEPFKQNSPALIAVAQK